MPELITLNNIESNTVDSLIALATNNATLDGTTTLSTIAEKTSLPTLVGWSQQAKIQASDKQAGDYFGQSVSISSDGNTAVVGANLEDTYGVDAGRVYLCTRSGTSWTNFTFGTVDIQAGEQFGNSVAISGDGNTVVVGAYFEDTGATDRGSAYIYVRSGINTWSKQASLAPSVTQSSMRYGGSVSISSNGNTVIVGAYGDASGGGVTWSGAAYIYIRSGTTWSQQARIAGDISQGVYFGSQVSMSGDGLTVAVGVGVLGDIYVFAKSGSTWPLQTKITGIIGASAGMPVSLSSNGNTLIAGANLEDTGATDAGAAYIFVRSGTSWSQQAKIQASDKEAGDNFGNAVSISSDGNTAIVCAFYEDTGASNAGAAYIFTRSGTTWTQQAKIEASDPEANDYFGNAVSISGDGLTAIVGTRLKDTGGTDAGAAYVFSEPVNLFVFDISQSSTFVHDTATGNFTTNFTNVPTTNDRTISAALIIPQGATGYLPTAVQIDGVSQTFVWEDDIVPEPSINSTDVVSFILLRSGGAWTVLASLAKFGLV